LRIARKIHGAVNTLLLIAIYLTQPVAYSPDCALEPSFDVERSGDAWLFSIDYDALAFSAVVSIACLILIVIVFTDSENYR